MGLYGSTMRVRTIASALVLTLVAAGACSSSDPGPESTDDSFIDQDDAGDHNDGLLVTDQDVRDLATQVCSAVTPEAIARDYGVGSTEPVALAEAYAAGYQPEVSQAAFEGCLAGIEQRAADG